MLLLHRLDPVIPAVCCYCWPQLGMSSLRIRLHALTSPHSQQQSLCHLAATTGCTALPPPSTQPNTYPGHLITAPAPPPQGAQSATRGGPFSVINGAAATDALCIHVPASTTVTTPIHILHIQTSGSTSAPRVLIVADSSSSLEVVEEYVSAGQAAAAEGASSSFCCPIAEVVLAEGAALKHAYLEREAAGAACMKGTLVAQAARSEYTLVEARVGGSLTRHDVGVVQVRAAAG